MNPFYVDALGNIYYSYFKASYDFFIGQIEIFIKTQNNKDVTNLKCLYLSYKEVCI